MKFKEPPIKKVKAAWKKETEKMDQQTKAENMKKEIKQIILKYKEKGLGLNMIDSCITDIESEFHKW